MHCGPVCVRPSLWHSVICIGEHSCCQKSKPPVQRLQKLVRTGWPARYSHTPCWVSELKKNCCGHYSSKWRVEQTRPGGRSSVSGTGGPRGDFGAARIINSWCCLATECEFRVKNMGWNCTKSERNCTGQESSAMRRYQEWNEAVAWQQFGAKQPRSNKPCKQCQLQPFSDAAINPQSAAELLHCWAGTLSTPQRECFLDFGCLLSVGTHRHARWGWSSDVCRGGYCRGWRAGLRNKEESKRVPGGWGRYMCGCVRVSALLLRVKTEHLMTWLSSHRLWSLFTQI